MNQLHVFRSCCCLCVLFAPTSPWKTIAQTNPPVVEWEATYDGQGYGLAVEQTDDGGFIIAGATTVAGTDETDLYLLRTDRDGNRRWERKFGGDESDLGRSVQPTADGGFIVVGTTGIDGDLATGRDVYVVRTDSGGEPLWEATFGADGDEEGRCVQTTSDGGYVIAGWTDSFGAGAHDAWLIKVDSGGNLVWSRTFGGERYDQAYSLQPTRDGGYIVVGWTESLGSGSSPDDVYLIKTDSDGHAIWERNLLGPDAWGNSVHEIQDGGYIVTGEYEPGDDDDLYVLKTDERGELIWVRSFGHGQGYSVIEASGGYAVAGRGGLLRTDSDGNLLWEKHIGRPRSVRNTSDGGFIVVGSDSGVRLVKLQSVPFRRGDSNADGGVDLADPIFTLTWLFRRGPEPSCQDAADADDDGRLNITDPVYLLSSVLHGGGLPPAPSETCGGDPTSDPVDCGTFPPCR